MEFLAVVAVLLVFGVFVAWVTRMPSKEALSPSNQEEVPPETLALPSSIPRLEMEIEELKDERRLHEAKEGSGAVSWCGVLLVLVAIVWFLFSFDLFVPGLLTIGAAIFFYFGNRQAKSSSVISDIDQALKARREKIISLKENSE